MIRQLQNGTRLGILLGAPQKCAAHGCIRAACDTLSFSNKSLLHVIPTRPSSLPTLSLLLADWRSPSPNLRQGPSAAHDSALPPVFFLSSRRRVSPSASYITVWFAPLFSGAMAARGTQRVSPSISHIVMRGRSEPITHRIEELDDEREVRTTRSDGGSPMLVKLPPYVKPPSNYPPTARDWENHRRVFTQLYSVENKTLDQVMEIMKNEYGFKAT